MTAPKKFLIITIVVLLAGLGIYLSKPQDQNGGKSDINPQPVAQDQKKSSPVADGTQKTVKQLKPAALQKNVFDTDIQAREAYSLCKQHDKSLQDCVTTLSDHYYSGGFELLADNGTDVVAGYLTLPIKDSGFVSIRYDDGSVLLGNQIQLIHEAKKNRLPGDLNALLLRASRIVIAPVKKM